MTGEDWKKTHPKVLDSLLRVQRFIVASEDYHRRLEECEAAKARMQKAAVAMTAFDGRVLKRLAEMQEEARKAP